MQAPVNHDDAEASEYLIDLNGPVERHPQAVWSASGQRLVLLRWGVAPLPVPWAVLARCRPLEATIMFQSSMGSVFIMLWGWERQSSHALSRDNPGFP